MSETLGGLESSKEYPIIQHEPLLAAVYREKFPSKLPDVSSSTEVAREVERRYLPARLLGVEQLVAMPGAYARHIEQRYVWAYKSDKDSGKKQRKFVRFRLRKTAVIHGANEEGEGTLYRVAYKRKTKKNPNARNEVQEKIRAGDPDVAKREADFLRLWEHGVDVGSMSRFYIPHTFTRPIEKDGVLVDKTCTCEIHYEIRHEPPSTAGFVRIEVEFENDEDEAYARDHKNAALPDWIGRDVTDDKRYKSSSLQAYGLPEEGRELMARLNSG